MKLSRSLSLDSVLLTFSAIIVVIIFFRYIFPGILELPVGDNLTIHVALARSFLDGTFLHPNFKEMVLYPASNETILAFLLLLGIPTNIFNILGIFVLFGVSMYVGRIYGFRPSSALFFAIAISSTYGVLRCVLSQAIDIWLLTYFLLTLALLHKPKRSAKHYLLLGFSSGMLLGSRFTAPLTLFSLFVLYYRNFLKYINLKSLLGFTGMLSFFGLFWYIRNLLVAGNPFYPQPFLMFPGACKTVCEFLTWTVWKSFITNPPHLVNAFISEYMIWSPVFVLLPIFYLVTRRRGKDNNLLIINRLILVGIINLVFYFFFPSYKYYDSVVAGVRYSYPAFAAFMLALFLLTQKLKRERILEIITFANLSFLILPVPYHPKILFIYVPLVTLLLLNLRKLRRLTVKNILGSRE